MRLITLSSYPFFFYINSLFNIVSIRPLVLISAKRRSVYFLLAIYFLSYIKEWALKSPKSMISPLASLIAILTLDYI